MDLNVAPTSDEDEEERVESAVDTLRREREERRLRMKRQREEERLEARHNGSSVVRQAPQSRESSRTAGLNLPEGWLDCPSMGEPVGGLFIPSKVPLGERFNEVIAPGKRFSKTHVLRTQRTRQREVAWVIDLTNTNRYYNPQEWLREGVKHVKVPCRGRDEVPEPEAVNQFVYEVIRFQGIAAKAPGKRYVLVHCTHGHNRTGYMIVHYLMRTQHIGVEKALKLFAEARPPGIYKQDYIESLYKFYHERRPEPLHCPRTPEWKRRTDVDLNGEANGDDEDDDDDGGILAALQEDATLPPNTMTNDDVLGDAIPDEQALEMQKYICGSLAAGRAGVIIPYDGVLVRESTFDVHSRHTHDITNSGKQPRFPGSQPVSLDRKNLQLLRQRIYYATWKADGTRYMLFLTRYGCYLIDRNFRFRRVELRFPLAKNSRDASPSGFHHLTLLDGEMVIDTVPGTGVQSRRYLVYDLMILNSRSLHERPFSERWKLIKDEVYDPRKEERLRSGHYIYENEKFAVRRKDFWPLSTAGKLLNVFIPQLSHEADGLILQGWADLYVPRTHEGLLKWKYARLNSVDFQLQVSPSGQQYQLFLMERGGKLKQLDGALVTFPEDQDPSTMVGKIIECSWNPEENKWEFMRIRKDKPTPNAWHVYEKVLASLHDKITEEVLLEEIAEICHLPMYVEHMAQIQRDQQQRAARGR